MYLSLSVSSFLMMLDMTSRLNFLMFEFIEVSG